MAKLYDFQVSGRTADSVNGTATGIIATKAIEFHDDGSVRFTSAAGRPIIITPDANLNELLKILLNGAGGLAPGYKLFGISN